MTVPEAVTPAPPQLVVVTLPDEIDMTNAGRVYQQIAAEFARGAPVVIADMTGTTFCDTLGTRAIVQACHRAARDRSELRLLPSPEVMRMWKILGLEAVLPIYTSLHEAMAGAGSPAR